MSDPTMTETRLAIAVVFEMLRALGNEEEARVQFDETLTLSTTAAERRHPERRLSGR